MKREIMAGLFMLFAALTISCAGGFGKAKAPEPAAIMVDAETGEPIEGAVAMAVQWDFIQLSWFEGAGSIVPDLNPRVTEAVSDSQGRIFIKDFWEWHAFRSDYPHLSVYKCGYVCWNQYRIFGEKDYYRYRHDFNEKKRIVRLRKRPEKFSFVDHERFINRDVTMGVLGHGHLLVKTVDQCEDQKYIEEYRKRK